MKWFLLLLVSVIYCKGQVTLTPAQSNYVVSEDGGSVTVCVDVSVGGDPTPQQFTVTFDDSQDPGQTASSGSDYPFTSTPVSAMAIDGELVCTDITIFDDDSVEGTEYINITISASNDTIIIDDPTIIVSIVDNDVLAFTVLNSSVSLEEGGSEIVCVTFEAPIQPPPPSEVTATIIDQQTESTDYSIDPQMLSFGSSPSVECVTITATNDTTPEGTETFTIQWSASPIMATFTPVTTTVTIESQLVPSLASAATVDAREGGTVTVCVELNGNATEEIEYMYTLISGTATDGDYSPTNGTLNILPGDRTGCIDIQLTDDSVVERTESFTVSFDSSDISDVVVNIMDNDELTLTTPSTVTISEDKGCTTVSLLNVNSSMIDIPLQVTATPVDGMALAGMDFNFTTVTVNEPMDIQLCVNGDDVIEGPEDFSIAWTLDTTGFNITLLNTLTIVTINDSTSVSVGFRLPSVSINEDIGVYSTQLEYSPPNVLFEAAFNVMVTYTNGTAYEGRDFLFTDETVPWVVANPVNPPKINVTIIDDNIVEHNETFTLSLNILANGLNISPSITDLDLTIIDDDQSIIDTPIERTYEESDGTVSLCFDHSNDITDDMLYTLSYNVVDGGSATGGVDYSLSDGSITIPLLPSEEICVNITIMEDEMVENRESFVIRWSLNAALPGGVSLRNQDTTIYINDNDVVMPTTTAPPSSSTAPPSISTTTPSSTNLPTTTSSSIFGIYTIIGIIVAVVALGVCFLLVLICIICCVRVKMNREGFYTTNEDKGEAPQMLRYSASLRSLQSQTVMPADPRDKENEYMV